jgi:flavin reductase (DIM6/NTAB) family NADH-FMN oxidoreductase RutF
MKKSLGAKTLAFPLPAFLVGTYDADGKPNIMTAAWGGIVCSEPPCIAVAVRPQRWTHSAVLQNQAFTVSIPNTSLAAATDYVGIVSGKNHEKFRAAGLTPVSSDLVRAPYVAECPVVLECSLHKTLELGSHTLFVGRIEDVKAEENLVSREGVPDIALVDPIIYSVGGSYHKVGAPVGKAFSLGKTLKLTHL